MLRSRFFWGLVLEIALVDLVVMIVMDTYHSVLHHSPWDEMGRLLVQTGYLVLILLLFQLLNQKTETDLSQIALRAVPLYVLFCFAARQSYKSFLKKKDNAGDGLIVETESSTMPQYHSKVMNERTERKTWIRHLSS